MQGKKKPPTRLTAELPTLIATTRVAFVFPWGLGAGRDAPNKPLYFERDVSAFPLALSVSYNSITGCLDVIDLKRLNNKS